MPIKDENGFTLVEVIVSLSLLLILALLVGSGLNIVSDYTVSSITALDLHSEEDRIAKAVELHLQNSFAPASISEDGTGITLADADGNPLSVRLRDGRLEITDSQGQSEILPDNDMKIISLNFKQLSEKLIRVSFTLETSEKLKKVCSFETTIFN